MKRIDADNLIIRQKDKVELQRHQVLVLETNRILTPEDKVAFRQDVLNQIESGLVILPSWVKAVTLDADVVVIM